MLYNLREIHHPTAIEEAVGLLRRKDVRTFAMAGGTALIGEGGPEVEAVVSLDGLGLDEIDRDGGRISLGAMARLQTIVDELGAVADGLLAETARRMAGLHIRNTATVGGSLFGSSANAPLLSALAALQAEVIFYSPDQTTAPLLTFLKERDRHQEEGLLVVSVELAVPGDGVGFGYADVGRTPADAPIVWALARVGDGAAGLWLGGLGPDVLALSLDDDVAALVAELADIPNDFLGGDEYRAEMALVLSQRAVSRASAR